MTAALDVQYRIIKDTSQTLRELLLESLRHADDEPIDVITVAPGKDAVPGNRPIVSLYLYNLGIDEEGVSGNRGDRRIERVEDENGKFREIARDPPLWIRLDYLITAFGRSPEHEQLLLGAAIRAIAEHPTITGNTLIGESMSFVEEIPLLMSHKLDEGVLSRFWSSLGQVIRPTLQLWTTVPVYPTTAYDISRVSQREVRFLDMNRVAKVDR